MEEKQSKKPQLPSAFSLFRPSFEALMGNVWTFLALFLVPMAGLTFILPVLVAGQDRGEVSMLAIVIACAAVLLFAVVAPALPYLQLHSVQGHEVSIDEALKFGLKNFLRFYALSLLVGLIVIVGFILLIVPGFFMIRRYYLAPYYLYDRKLGVLEAMRACAADSKRFSGAIWGMIGVVFLIQLPGIIPIFGLVTFALMVMYYCAPAVRYFQIKAVHKS